MSVKNEKEVPKFQYLFLFLFNLKPMNCVYSLISTCYSIVVISLIRFAALAYLSIIKST